MTDLNYVLWAFALAIALASVYTFYIRRFQGRLVRKLIAIDACSPETAISLDKIDYKMNSVVQNDLRRKSSFSETVMVTDSGLYYINPANLDKAKAKYKNESMSVFLLIGILIFVAGIVLLCTYIIPGIIEKYKEIIEKL